MSVMGVMVDLLRQGGAKGKRADDRWQVARSLWRRPLPLPTHSVIYVASLRSAPTS